MNNMATRFNTDEMAQYLIIASLADPDDFADAATKAAIYKAKAHVIDNGGGELWCPPITIRRR